MEKKENILGCEKISKLMMKFSIPCIISMLVNSLYNIVDQIFIGWGVGYLGNGATNVVFPISIVCLAFALMFGDGASSFLSLKLGQKRKEEAAKGVANGVLLSAILSIVLCIIGLVFLPNLIQIFGCTDNLKQYALEYGYVTVIGIPFFMVGTTLNSIIRADGSPKYAMTSMLTGAILNIILDPIFIFALHMGVEGAAIATVISQIITFILNVSYMKKFKSIEVHKDNLKLEGSVIKKVVSLGISSFITQMNLVIIMAVSNNLLGKYGAESEYGSEIPITVLGIVMKINQILMSIVIGIAAGAQPIIGYNYGAGQFDRVKKTLKTVLGCSVVISTIAFILFQTIPDKLISIFGNGDEKYMDFACLAFRTFLLLCICNGVQIPSSIFFQAIGKSSISAVLSLSRQIILSIPAMIILSSIYGVVGVLYAGPVADGIAFLLVLVFLTREIKQMKQQKTVVNNVAPKQEKQESTTAQPVVITIAREFGSGGRIIGKKIADQLGIPLYDKELIAEVAQDSGLSEEYIEKHEQKRGILANLNSGYYAGLNNADDLFLKETETIKKVAQKSCVIIGRCANFILQDQAHVIRIFVQGSLPNRIKRATEVYGLKKDTAEKEICKIDKLRANHCKHYTDGAWSDSNYYDICINSDALGLEKTADLICEMAKEEVKEC